MALKNLPESYPGRLIEDAHPTGANAVIDRSQQIIARPRSRWPADLYLNHLHNVADRLATALPDRFDTLGRLSC